jgi:hypothetical protein
MPILYVLQILVLIAAALEIRLRHVPFTRPAVSEVFLRWSLAINGGLAGIMGFLGHTLQADEIAQSIGWPTGNPFQFEVAVTSLAIGVLGCLCLRLRGDFWLATIIVMAVFLWGAAAGHIYQIVTAQNYAPGNAGAVLYWDILVPLAQIGLLLLSREGKPSGSVAPRPVLAGG